MSVFVKCDICEEDGWHISQMHKKSNVCKNCHSRRTHDLRQANMRVLKLISIQNRILELELSNAEKDTLIEFIKSL